MHQGCYTIRVLCLMLLMLVTFGAMGYHLYRVQVCRHNELLLKAQDLYTTSRTVTGTRGAICDIHGNLLAGNLACRDVTLEPRLFRKHLSFLIPYLSRQLGLSKRQVIDKLAQAYRVQQPQVEVVLVKGIDIPKAELMAAELARQKVRGVYFRESNRRYYPKKSMCANLVGFVDGENKGTSGIEKRLEERIRPVSGRRVFERDRRGVMIDQETEREVARARDGANVYLTIDEAIQQIVENELRLMVEAHAPKAAYALMANPKNGAILAWSQLPTFDPNERKVMNPECWQNRILVDGFEPGSIMKAMAIAGALDCGVVTLDTTIDCEGGRWFYCGRSLRDSGHSYGRLQVRHIVQKSSNIGTAKIALMMGDRRLDDTLFRFGFGQRTGIGFPEEATGIYRRLPKWDGLSITRFPIGQGVLVTPLQMVQAYCALANRGQMYQLNVIDRIQDPESGLCEVTPPRFKGMVVDHEETVTQIVSALKMVTQEGGTAVKAAVPGHEVAGKTGTAQKVVNGQYVSRYVASFIGFVPAEDPAFVLFVVADEPSKGGYYGGTVASPVFSRIAEKTLRYLQIAPAKAPYPGPMQPASPPAPGSVPPDKGRGPAAPALPLPRVAQNPAVLAANDTALPSSSTSAGGVHAHAAAVP